MLRPLSQNMTGALSDGVPMSNNGQFNPQFSRRRVLSAVVAGTATLVNGKIAAACTDPTPSPSGPRPIYVHTPNAVSASVMAAYNAQPAYCLYWLSTFDREKNGMFESGPVEYTRVPADFSGVVSLDWESIPYNPFGSSITNFALGLGKIQGTDSTQRAIEAQALKAIKAYKAVRPKAIWGMYDIPRSNSQYRFLNRSGAYWNQPDVIGAEFLSELGATNQSAYCRYPEASSTIYPKQITKTDLYTCMYNLALTGLRCSEKGGWKCKTIPFVSRVYYANDTSLSFHRTVAPNQWIYQHCKALGDAVWNGHKIDGLYIWDGASTPSMTEAQLKAVYQGLNGLPYDPNMPRPSTS
jgi:hypothetical protein